MDVLSTLLLRNDGTAAYKSNVCSLNIGFGDGSGSGMGGTHQLFDEKGPSTLVQWRGVWDISVNTFTSNWKELRSILLAIERLDSRSTGPILAGSSLVLFTDNLVSYYIMKSGSSKFPRLHELVLRIQLKLIQLDIQLLVIWIPGKLMILEGSDGLSRGLWISPCRGGTLSSEYVPSIFRPAPHNAQVAESIALVSGSHQVPKWVNHLRPLHHKIIVNKCTFFTPPPQVARQIMNDALSYWVEVPRTTSIFFLIPRVLQHEWGRVNRHMITVGIFDPVDLPFRNSLLSTMSLTL